MDVSCGSRGWNGSNKDPYGRSFPSFHVDVESTTISIQELTILNPVASNVVDKLAGLSGVMAITLGGLSELTL